MASSLSDPMTCYSHTQRIVLLIDLDPLLHNNSHHYIKNIISSVKTLLSFFSTSTNSLSAFKFFFSSLSPLLSTSKLHPYIPNSSLSFDHPSSTLQLLSHTLSSLPQFPHTPPLFHSNASHIASSITRLLHDYAWEPDLTTSTLPIPSNLVLLISPLFPSFHSLASFFNIKNDEISLLQIETSFSERFSSLFGNVSCALRSKGVHCSWIGVNCNGVGDDDEAGKVRGLFEIGVRKLGWGFCSLDSILYGSALVPFGLIYPKIGVSWFSIKCCSREVKFHVQLSLGILDVNGNPIEYNCCDLELVDFRVFGREEGVNLKSGDFERKEKLWSMCSDGLAKLRVKVVRRCDAFVGLKDCLSDSVLVRGVFGESKNKQKGDSDEFFADRVLELLGTEFGFPGRQKSEPIWEILMSFLYKEGCWALVSVENGNGGGSCVGILRPFTVSSALLSVMENPQLAFDFGGANIDHCVRTSQAKICESDCKFNKNRDLLDSQVKSAVGIEGKQKKKSMDLNELRKLSWNSFCDLVHDQFEMDLHEVYYTIGCNKSKTLKFFKCWMRQVKKSGCCDIILSGKPKPNEPDEPNEPNEITAEGIDCKSTELPQNGEQPISPLVSTEVHTEVSIMQDDAVLDLKTETPEAFFSDLSNKINQGIESEVIDLGALAERLVKLSVYWLCQKDDVGTNSQSHSHLIDNSAYGSMVVSELMKLLLREPKEIAAKHKGRNSFSQASDVGTTTIVTEHAVREYELQILFRMEILQSEVGSGIEDSSKQKFVKQICLLFENIQCHMEGGFFGAWNLESYVSKIIKSRYSHSLEDVVKKIYNKMDLLQFADEDEAPDFKLNSEDSIPSLNLKVYGDKMGENDISSEPFSGENEPFDLQKNDRGISQRILGEDYHKKLMEAKEKRERARRFSSLSTWKPDWLRVWAPKQKDIKLNTDRLRKFSKRKELPSASCDRVCETPLTTSTRKRWSSPGTVGSDDERYLSGESQIRSSVSKALF